VYAMLLGEVQEALLDRWQLAPYLRINKTSGGSRGGCWGKQSEIRGKWQKSSVRKIP
jgi:hypothetical protein